MAGMRCMVMLKVALLVSAILIPAFSAASVSAPVAGNPWEELLETLKMELHSLAPLNLLVGDYTGLLANITLGKWSSHKTFFPIWSATKLMSGAAFFALDAEGILPLDTKVSDYLEFWSTNSSDQRSFVTMRHLLNFTSGFVTDADCVFIPFGTFDACTAEIYKNNFVEGQFGYANYGENHLHIAQTIALRVTGAASWGDLWYEKVGKPAGLPEDNYYTWPSATHPAGGAGMTISSDHYSIVLARFHESLYSKDKPTQPLKMGEGMGYGSRFWGLGNNFKPVEGDVVGDDMSYAHTSWRQSAESWIHSVGCRGWFPVIVPTTNEGAGWWMQLAREGAMPVCLGSVRVLESADDWFDVIIKAVKDHRKHVKAVKAYSASFKAIDEDFKCVREPLAKAYCECSEIDPMQCGIAALCSTPGYMTEKACMPPHTTFMEESNQVCSKCETEAEGPPVSIVVTMPKPNAEVEGPPSSSTPLPSSSWDSSFNTASPAVSGTFLSAPSISWVLWIFLAALSFLLA